MRLLLLVLTFLQLQPEGSNPRTAVERALPILQSSARDFVSKRSCFSCHHNALPILTLHMARNRGFAIDASALTSIEAATFSPLLGPDALDQSIQATGLSDPTPNDSFLLMAAASAGIERSLTTAVRARQLLSWQHSGHWVTSDFRPPHSSSLFTATATAVRAIHFYAPDELNFEKQRAVAQAREWLRKTSPSSTEDAAFRRISLACSTAAPTSIAEQATVRACS